MGVLPAAGDCQACSGKNSEVVVGCGARGAFPGWALAPKILGLKETTCELGSGLLGKPSWSSLVTPAITGVLGCFCIALVPVLGPRSSFAHALCTALPVTLWSAFCSQEVKSCLCSVALS